MILKNKRLRFHGTSRFPCSSDSGSQFQVQRFDCRVWGLAFSLVRRRFFMFVGFGFPNELQQIRVENLCHSLFIHCQPMSQHKTRTRNTKQNGSGAARRVQNSGPEYIRYKPPSRYKTAMPYPKQNSSKGIVTRSDASRTRIRTNCSKSG